MMDLIDRIIDEASFYEIKKLFAPELITGLARIHGQPVGIIANQPRVKGGVLFHDSADKAAKFINCVMPIISRCCFWLTSPVL